MKSQYITVVAPFLPHKYLQKLLEGTLMMRWIVGVPAEGTIGPGVGSEVDVVQDVSSGRSLGPGHRLMMGLDRWLVDVRLRLDVNWGFSSVPGVTGHRGRGYRAELDDVDVVDRDRDVARSCPCQSCEETEDEEFLKSYLLSFFGSFGDEMNYSW